MGTGESQTQHKCTKKIAFAFCGQIVLRVLAWI